MALDFAVVAAGPVVVEVGVDYGSFPPSSWRFEEQIEWQERPWETSSGLQMLMLILIQL